MTRAAFTLAALAALTLSACDKGKPRHVPDDPMAIPEVAEPVAPPTTGLSAGLSKKPQMAGFTLDHIGQASDPLNKQPAVTAAGKPIVLDGFGFDPLAKAPGKGVDVVVDDKPYGTVYGAARQDVAAYFKTPALAPVGFKATLPGKTLAPGPHTVLVRVVSTDGKGYFESPPIPFEVK